MERKVALAIEVEQLKVQEVENLKQELTQLCALALKGTTRPSTSSIPQILGPSMHIHDFVGSSPTWSSMESLHDCHHSVATT